jgi:hypothetical protein
MDALGVQIIEGEHPGSTYHAAELRQDIDYANQVARDIGLECRFVSARSIKKRPHRGAFNKVR